jgi:hypothetical protein
MARPKKQKPYWEMKTSELAAATAQHDRPMPGLPGKPLTKKDRKLLARANQKTGN